PPYVADRLVAEHGVDQPPQDRHTCVERAQLPALALQIAFTDCGDGVGLRGVRLDLSVRLRLGRVVAFPKFALGVDRSLAGIGRRHPRPWAGRGLGWPPAEAIAQRPASMARWLRDQIQADASGVRYLPPGRAGLEVLDEFRADLGHGS